jgi:hypothetical protein
MTNRRTLRAEDLRVESFPTAEAGVAAGTMDARLFSTGLNCPETNYISCPRAFTCTAAAAR